jgi:glycyl-tRNA synthetase
MQSVILALQQFWAERGCLIWQPYYTQVGAGTMNPATFLRVLGPEPWRVAYVEPSIRPDDARYGENPNRMQQHYQFQVVLKPDPGNAQDLYLHSLLSIGIDPRRHDIRFVEDKWEAPALGAWGLGWEVWLDGQEITQFTYFQQAGGRTLDPVSVEITYGLERILIGLLSLDHFKDIPWNETLTYGDVQLKAEQEYGRYYLDTAVVGRLREILALNQAEARSALDHGLVLPAYDHLLRCSHTFNVMDSRGAVGVTERAELFGGMRQLARAVSDAYLEQRESMGYPWMDRVGSAVEPPAVDEGGPPPSAADDFVFEIGTEELPAGDVAGALRYLGEAAPRLLEQAGLTHGEIRVDGTPRRLVLTVRSLASEKPAASVLEQGPAESKAFDKDGSLTSAGKGWARKMGLSADAGELRRLVRSINGKRILCLDREIPPQAASHVLAGDALPTLLGGMQFDQSMRWNASGVTFSRPIRWLLALHGGHVVPFEYAGVRTGATTRGLRLRDADAVRIPKAGDYASRLQGLEIVVDPSERRQRILAQAQRLVGETGGTLALDEDLLQEVIHLVESPQCLLGKFDSAFLDLPEEVLVAVMRKHQRYIPIRDKEGRLLPRFVAVANGVGEDLATIRAGNEHVLRARFADAAFFLKRDRRVDFEYFRSKTALITFQHRLGSILDKTTRIERLTPLIAKTVLDLAPEAFATAVRAATLCKADLATAMVTEMTSLQGVIGRIYAREWGEPEPVAQAVYEHYLPRFSGDTLPESAAGAAVGLADRLDTLAGLFAAGMQPTGTRDPFGLRRTAIGLIQILVARDLHLDLADWLAQAGGLLPIEFPEESREACLRFVAARHEALLLADGHRHDVVQSVLEVQGRNPAGASRAASELGAAVQAQDWPPVLQAYARCARIIPRPTSKDSKERRGITKGQAVDGAADPGLFDEEAERGLFKALEGSPRPAASVAELLGTLRALVPPITTFFDKVLVMSEDPAQRRNRLALVQQVVSLAENVADLSRLEGF